MEYAGDEMGFVVEAGLKEEAACHSTTILSSISSTVDSAALRGSWVSIIFCSGSVSYIVKHGNDW